MDDNNVQALEEQEETVQNPRPVNKETVQPVAGVVPEWVMTGDQSAVRNVFVARATARTEQVGAFANMEMSDDGLAVRGAYRAHLSAGKETAIGSDPSADGGLLRRAYLSRAVASAAMPAPARNRIAKRSAAAGGKKRAAAQPNPTAASRASTKAKKRGGAGARASQRGKSRKR